MAIQKKVLRWRTNASAVIAFFKVPKGWTHSGLFYTGPTLYFGHSPAKKGKGKKG